MSMNFEKNINKEQTTSYSMLELNARILHLNTKMHQTVDKNKRTNEEKE